MSSADHSDDDRRWEAYGLALALTEVETRAPDSLRARLMASVDDPALRFAPFIDRLAAMIDVGKERAQVLLGRLADPSLWELPIGPEIEFMHLDGGPAVATADVGFVRLAPGVRFPFHRHIGAERVLILEGQLEDSDGSTAQAGDALFMGPESSHSFVATGDTPLTYAVVVDGVDIPGVTLPAK